MTEILLGFTAQTTIGCPAVTQLTLFPRWSRPIWITAWEQRKLGEFGSVAMCKRIYKEQTSEQGDVPFFKIGTFGADPDAFISNELFEDFKRTYPYPTPGTSLISAAGSIGRIVEYQGEKAYFQDSNIVWLEHDHRLNDAFLKPLYSQIEWGLEGSTIKRLYNKDLLSAEVTIPDDREQKVIGQFFAKLDNLITLHQRKCQCRSLCGYLSWEQRKFADFVTASGIRNSENLELPSYSVTNDRGFVPQDEQFENGGTMREADKTSYWIVEPRSFAYNPARINVGSIGYQSTSGNVIVSSLYEVFRTDETCDDRFLWHWFKTRLFAQQIEMLQEGGVRLYFFFDKLLKSVISMPSIDEQRLIGEQFDRLDDLITLHQ